MKKIKNKKQYVCAVDVPKNIIDKINEDAKPNNLNVKVMTHDLTSDNEKLSWEQRRKNVEKVLTTYQNASCVITSRLHVALPCLAMEVPVLLVRDDLDCNRFKPYWDLCHYMSTSDFCLGKYNILSPIENKKDYLKIRNDLIKRINEFIDETKNINDSLDKIVKTKYTDEEVKEWQFNLMKKALDIWFEKSRDMLREYNKTIDYLRGIEKKIEDLKNSTSWKITKPIRIAKEKMDMITKSRK